MLLFRLSFLSSFSIDVDWKFSQKILKIIFLLMKLTLLTIKEIINIDMSKKINHNQCKKKKFSSDLKKKIYSLQH